MKNQFGNDIEALYFDQYGHYKKKDMKDFSDDYNNLIALWKSFLLAQKENNLEFNKDYFVHQRNIFEVIKRLDKRRAYYYVFHKIDKICEYKEVAILCYWINTLKPFMVINENSEIYNSPNEMFSLYIIMTTIARIYKEIYPNEEFVFLDPTTIQDYVYNFKYCDLSRESMIFFC